MNSVVVAFSRFANWLAMFALVYMFGHIVLEIVLRNFFSTSTFVLDEFVGYAVSILTFMALGETLRRGAHIRVTLLTGAVPHPIRCTLYAFGYLSSVAVAGLGLWFIGQSVIRNFLRGTTSSSIAAIPQWIPQAFVFVGLFVFALQALVLLLDALRGHIDPETGEAL
jgi:TRAP-type C4-dicarboxylate transport system permease small subunit